METSTLLARALNRTFLSESEALRLYDLPLIELGAAANQLKIERHGDRVSYIRNYYLNFTNICRYACTYCGFRRNPGDADAYVLGLDEIERKLRSAPEQVREVWFSSGLNAKLPLQYYIDLIKLVKRVLPAAELKAFTAVEIDFFAKHFDKSWEEILDTFIAAGLDRIPAGGAEIFDNRIRKKIDVKTRPEDYLAIHRLCHQRDMQTAVTMLFGHVEERSHRIRHMLRVRDFQEELPGFQAFIPLAFQDQNNPLAKRGVRGPSAVEVLKTLAIGRILLPNVDHIQSHWVDSGEEVTQVSMHFGVDDINGTLIEENIAHQSGSSASTYNSSETLRRWITEAGQVPVERDCFFRIVEEPKAAAAGSASP